MISHERDGPSFRERRKTQEMDWAANNKLGAISNDDLESGMSLWEQCRRSSSECKVSLRFKSDSDRFFFSLYHSVSVSRCHVILQSVNHCRGQQDLGCWQPLTTECNEMSMRRDQRRQLTTQCKCVCVCVCVCACEQQQWQVNQSLFSHVLFFRSFTRSSLLRNRLGCRRHREEVRA